MRVGDQLDGLMSILGLLRMGWDSLFRKEFPGLEPGAAAPRFEAPDQHGVTRTLDEFRGKWVVLWFFPKADTPG